MARASGDRHSQTVDVIQADEISGAGTDRRDGRLLAALTRDEDEGHVYSAGAAHSESSECVNCRHAMGAEHEVPGFLGDERGGGIRALNDQNRE